MKAREKTVNATKKSQISSYLMAFQQHAPFPFLILMILLPSSSHQTEDPPLIDRIVRDYALRSFPKHHSRTAHLYRVQLPSNLSGITADVARFRAGSLRRHGAAVNEFRLAPGIVVHPHMKRLMVVYQNLGNHSYIYSSYQNFSDYQLVSPVLGLLIYNASSVVSTMKLQPLMVNFSKVVAALDVNNSMCAAFLLDGKVSLSNLSDRSVCAAWSQGHFAIVVRSKLRQGEGNKAKRISKWKVVVMGAIGGVIGAVLLGLVLVAVANVKRKKSQIAELERRAYEEEALQVSMVGHVRAPTAPVTRTTPALENDCSPTF